MTRFAHTPTTTKLIFNRGHLRQIGLTNTLQHQSHCTDRSSHSDPLRPRAEGTEGYSAEGGIIVSGHSENNEHSDG